MKLIEITKIIIEQSLNEETFDHLTLYRGVDEDYPHPTISDYSFFAKDKSFAEDYGEYIWKCTFEPLNLFISYKDSSIKELYDNGFKLRDEYIEDMWDESDEWQDIYDYDEYGDFDDWGFKSAEHLISNPYLGSDTWEMIENSHGVLDYILSKYDGVVLLEGGQVTYYLDTDKIINCELLTKK